MQEKRNDQPREVVGLQYSQGDQEEENNSRPANDVFGQCQSSQELEEPNAAVSAGQTSPSDNAEVAAGQTSPSDNVPLAQSLPTVPKEPTVPKGSASGTISQAVSEPTRQNQLTKIVPVQPSDKDTKARSLFEVFICRYIYVSFFCMSSDEIETMYVCRSPP